MGEERQERRQDPRVVVGDKTKGRINGIGEVSVLNLSPGGALIEHAEIVRPNTIAHLVLTLAGRETRVPCRVVWSAIHRAEVQPDGEQELIFRTGVEFPNPSEETRQAISDYIQSNTGNGTRSSAGEPGLREHPLRELEEIDRLVNAARRALEEGTTPSNGAV